LSATARPEAQTLTPTISDVALVVIAVFVAIALFHGWG
jgi:hypothetical protein